ncbi:MAG: SDR family oxidoreductase [Actinomycetales bacterium]|nr:SDR family oxidoreductase [Actinomycetales bacterium]
MAEHAKWTEEDLPNLTGREVIVTGANSGLGLCTAQALARAGASVTMAVRDVAKGDGAKAQIIGNIGSDANISVARLDLADLASVRDFAQTWSAAHPAGLDLLINNAGIMAIPRRPTADGFETQFGTNHLGHFALTALLWPALIARTFSRVVTVSSQAHRMGRMNWDDLMGEHRYSSWGAYGQSKLANLLFTLGLQQRIDDAGLGVLALAAHPGYSSTNLQAAGPAMRGSNLGEKFVGIGNRILAQPAEMGALPTLYAATAPNLPNGSYIGPDGFFEQRGHPKVVDRSARAKDVADADRLWLISEDLTGINFPID